MTRRLGSLLALLAVGALTVTVTGSVTGAAPALAARRAVAPHASHVVVVGVPGLRWQDVDPVDTPTLWGLVSQATIGNLSVRSASSYTCPGDGWLQVGTGNRARMPSTGSAGGSCPALPAVRRDGPGGLVTDWSQVIDANAALPYDSVPGALAGAVAATRRCVSAAGDGADLGAANPGGRVAQWRAAAALATPGFLARCPVALVSTDALVGGRSLGALRAVDELVGRIDQDRPAGSLLVVVGVSEIPYERSQLHVAMALGPGFHGGELVSASTRRAPFVQLTDLAPTVLTALGLPVPAEMPYQPWQRRVSSRDPGLASEIARLRGLELQAERQNMVIPPFFLFLVVSQLALYGASYVALRRLPRGRWRADVLRLTRWVAVAFATVPVATFLANLLPWWRSAHPLPMVVLAVTGFAGLLTVLALVGPWRRHPFGPAGFVCVVTAVVLAVDVVTGARLQLSSLAGYSPIVAGRFAGFGNLAFAVFGCAALLAAAAVVSRADRRTAGWVVAAIGAVAVLVDGLPPFGADFGGVVTLVPSFVVLWMLVTGRALSWWRLLLAGLGGVALVLLIAFVDHLRPADQQTHLGRFIGQVMDGSAGTVVVRKLEANLSLLTSSVLTVLVPVAVVYLVFLLRRPNGLLPWTFERVPTLRAGLVATVVLAVLGALVNDSGVAIPAIAAVLVIPVAIAVVAAALAADSRERQPVPSTDAASPAASVARGPQPDG